MAKTIENLFQLLHRSANVFIVLLFLLFIKKAKSERAIVLIALYALTELILNLSASSFAKNLFSYIWGLFTYFEYLVFTYILQINIKNKRFKKFIVICSVLFLIFTTIFNIVTNFKGIDSIPIGVETILILIFCFYFLYEQMNSVDNLFIYNKYQFWIVIGFMIYLAGSFFVFISASMIDNNLLRQYWFLTNCFYISMLILFAIAIFVYIKKTKKTSNSHNLRPYLN